MCPAARRIRRAIASRKTETGIAILLLPYQSYATESNFQDPNLEARARWRARAGHASGSELSASYCGAGVLACVDIDLEADLKLEIP